jgi:xanthine dehydrogenase large subunit
VQFAGRCGYSHDLSSSINDRTMFHADNAYFYPQVHIHSRRLKTHTVSNTAFRGFGGPQGMVFAERLMDRIAWATGRDPLDVRYANLYGTEERNITPYGMVVEDNVAGVIMRQLEASSDYRRRREEIGGFNARSRVLKKGLALTPVKFGISFTTTFLNQAGALVHVYQDGSIHLNHGGTEMGQGLFIKVAQVVAEEFGVALDRVRITATHTGKVPNTSPTAASSGTDMNGMAAKAAAAEIKGRIAEFIARDWQVPVASIAFRDDRVWSGEKSLTFAEVVKKAYLARTHLSATGFYATPKITWDRPKATGRPFFYFAYGASCSEVTVDTLTGEFTLDRVDILHDAGRSLNPAIDIGQIEGGFVQGMGWLAMEELVFDAKGRLRTHAPSTYKIPTSRDVPADFRVAFFDNPNREDTIYRSKAIGEPPLMLAISVLHALSDAVASVGGHRVCPRLDAPATPERVLGGGRAGGRAGVRRRAHRAGPGRGAGPSPPPGDADRRSRRRHGRAAGGGDLHSHRRSGRGRRHGAARRGLCRAHPQPRARLPADGSGAPAGRRSLRRHDRLGDEAGAVRGRLPAQWGATRGAVAPHLPDRRRRCGRQAPRGDRGLDGRRAGAEFASETTGFPRSRSGGTGRP